MCTVSRAETRARPVLNMIIKRVIGTSNNHFQVIGWAKTTQVRMSNTICGNKLKTCWMVA
jgi:hypothetical protein